MEDDLYHLLEKKERDKDPHVSLELVDQVLETGDSALVDILLCWLNEVGFSLKESHIDAVLELNDQKNLLFLIWDTNVKFTQHQVQTIFQKSGFNVQQSMLIREDVDITLFPIDKIICEGKEAVAFALLQRNDFFPTKQQKKTILLRRPDLDASLLVRQDIPLTLSELDSIRKRIINEPNIMNLWHQRASLLLEKIASKATRPTLVKVRL